MDEERTQIITIARTIEVGLDGRLHCLELVEGIDVGRRHLVGPSGLTIGRVPPADIVLGDTDVSRAHCRVVLAGDDLVVTDLNSTNGTYVDGVRLQPSAILPANGILQVGHQAFKHELLTGKQVQKSDDMDRELAAAFSYVQALLPAPLTDGPIRADWVYKPCSKLGGDAFGYGPLGGDLFGLYLIDVSGHGAGAAMHSVAVMNLLRQQALPACDMTQPAKVLETLNAMFQMEAHAEMYFTMWYGVYNVATRRLDYAAAGHHPAYLIASGRGDAIPLGTRNSLIGAVPGKTYQADHIGVPRGASIYLFSDGVFEIVTIHDLQWGLSDFLPLLSQRGVEGLTESERLFRAVRAAARPGELDDDFSLVVARFD